MGRLWRPVLIGAAVVVATFLLAQGAIFEPEAEAPQAPLTGDAERGAVVFESTCSGCHGPGGEGGTGPQLINTGLDATTVATTIERGAGVMPPGLVSGQEQADVTAFVVSIST